jgi:hypothetical protein
VDFASQQLTSEGRKDRWRIQILGGSVFQPALIGAVENGGENRRRPVSRKLTKQAEVLQVCKRPCHCKVELSPHNIEFIIGKRPSSILRSVAIFV